MTDRGRPVAELRPIEPSGEPFDGRLQRLVDLGVVSAIVRERPELEPFEAIELSGGSLRAAVLEDRGDRL